MKGESPHAKINSIRIKTIWSSSLYLYKKPTRNPQIGLNRFEKPNLNNVWFLFFFFNPKLFKENCELDLKRREVDDIYCLNMGAPWRAQIQSEEEEEEAQAHFIDVCKCVGVAANWMRQQEKKKGVARFEYKIRRKAHLQFKWAKRGVISPIFPSSSPTFPHSSSSNVYKSYRYIRRGYITVDRRRQQDELTLPFSLNLLFLLSWTTRPSFFFFKKIARFDKSCEEICLLLFDPSPPILYRLFLNPTNFKYINEIDMFRKIERISVFFLCRSCAVYGIDTFTKDILNHIHLCCVCVCEASAQQEALDTK